MHVSDWYLSAVEQKPLLTELIESNEEENY